MDLPDGTKIEYVIDGQNRRVGKKVNGTLVRGWLYGDQLRIVAELDGTGKMISRFVYGTRANVPDYMIRDGVTYRILSDHVGSPRFVLNAATGAPAQAITYSAFGEVLTDTNPGFQPFGFAGGLHESDSGLNRFGARDSDPHTGRWTTKEPLGFAGGSANFYEYAANAPINFVDIDGLKVYPANFVGPLQPGDTRSYATNMNDPEIEAMALGFQATRSFYPAGTPANLQGECVSLTKFFSRAPCTTCWRAGVPVMGSNIPPGTAVATFINGLYPQEDVPKNSGIFLQYIPNGFTIIDQWPGHYGMARDLHADPTQSRSNRADTYSVITAPAGECGCSTR